MQIQTLATGTDFHWPTGEILVVLPAHVGEEAAREYSDADSLFFELIT